MLTQREFVMDIEARALVAEVSVAKVCRVAGVKRNTWQRYKNETREAQYNKLLAMHQAISNIEKVQKIAPQRG